MALSMAMSQELDGLGLADVESAKPSATFMSNVITERKRRQRRE